MNDKPIQKKRGRWPAAAVSLLLLAPVAYVLSFPLYIRHVRTTHHGIPFFEAAYEPLRESTVGTDWSRNAMITYFSWWHLPPPYRFYTYGMHSPGGGTIEITYYLSRHAPIPPRPTFPGPQVHQTLELLPDISVEDEVAPAPARFPATPIYPSTARTINSQPAAR